MVEAADACLAELSALESLDLSLNHIQTVPELPDLPKLRALDLSHNLLDAFAPQQWSAACLVSLDLMANTLAEFDVSHLSLPALCRLNLSCNRLKTLVGLRNLTALTELDVARNCLQAAGVEGGRRAGRSRRSRCRTDRRSLRASAEG